MHRSLRALGAALVLVVVPALTHAQHAWTVTSADPGAAGTVGDSEDSRVSGAPWDPDGADDCGALYDVRCEWLVEHVGDDQKHQANGVLGASLDGSAAGQGVVFTSSTWSDSESTAATWWVTYDVHYVVIDPADLPDLRTTLRFKHAGVTRLTLNLGGIAGDEHVQHREAPLHVWVDTPETGDEWTLEITTQRTAAGEPALIWVDNILVTEGGVTLFEETFPEVIGVGDGMDVPAVGLRVAPNPARGPAIVQLELAAASDVAVTVHDALGRRMGRLYDGPLPAGRHRLQWSGRTDGGSAPAGVYFVRIETGSGVLARRLVRLRR